MSDGRRYGCISAASVASFVSSSTDFRISATSPARCDAVLDQHCLERRHRIPACAAPPPFRRVAIRSYRCRRSSARDTGSTCLPPASGRRRCARDPHASFTSRHTSRSDRSRWRPPPGHTVARRALPRDHLGSAICLAKAASSRPIRCSSTSITNGSLWIDASSSTRATRLRSSFRRRTVREHGPPGFTAILYRIGRADRVWGDGRLKMEENDIRPAAFETSNGWETGALRYDPMRARKYRGAISRTGRGRCPGQSPRSR